MDRPLPPDSEIADEILRQVQDRGREKSICPSEVARALSPSWQSLMGPVRRVAVQLAKGHRIEILRKGKPVDPDAVRGVIRLRLGDDDGGQRDE